MTKEESPLLAQPRSRWVAEDLHQLLAEVIALRASTHALETLREAKLADLNGLRLGREQGSFDGNPD